MVMRIALAHTEIGAVQTYPTGSNAP